jgi:hypothetical protein
MSTPYILPQGLHWLTVDADCRLLGDPVAVLSALTSQFVADDLLAAGVAVGRPITVSRGEPAARHFCGRPYLVAKGLVTGQLFVDHLCAQGVNLMDLAAEDVGGLLDQATVQFQLHVADRAHAAITGESQFL